MKRDAVLIGSLLAWILGCGMSTECTAGFLYAGAGNGSAGFPGGLFTVNQSNGSSTFIADSVTPGGITGLAFASPSLLYASTINAGVSQLVTINPDTGVLSLTIGTIVTGPRSEVIPIGDLAIQPGTGTLFGVRSNAGTSQLGGLLYTINSLTGVATLVGDTGTGVGGGIAFAPDGTLYQTALSTSGGFFSLNTLNPLNAARISTVATTGFFDGLAVREDGILFATPGNNDLVGTINPLTGAFTALGPRGNFTFSDLAFRPEASAVPEPSAAVLLLCGVGSLFAFRRRSIA